MNSALRTSPGGLWGKRHIREIRIGYVVLALFYVFVVFIPLLYEYKASIPDREKLSVASGILLCKEIGHRGNYLTGIQTGAGTSFFTCAGGKFGAYPNCIGPKVSDCQKLAGTIASALWFEQPADPLSTQKRLVQLATGGNEKLSYERTVELTHNGAVRALWLLLLTLVFFVFIVIGFERKIREHGHE